MTAQERRDQAFPEKTPRHYLDWPEDTPARREARYCANCLWRSKDRGDLFCSHCTPAYERWLAKQPLAEWDLVSQDSEGAVLRNVRAPFPVRDPVHPADCPCGCGDRDDYILGGR